MLLPAPDGPTSAIVSPALTRNDTASRAGDIRAGGIFERHVLERDRTERRLRQRNRVLGRADFGHRRHHLGKPLGRAGGLADFAPNFGKFGQRARREQRVEHELAEPTAGHARLR